MKKNSKVKLLLGISAIVTALFASACGVITDMAEDNEWRWGFFGKVDFKSPYKLRVAVAPFEDSVGLGAAGAGENLSSLMAEEFSKNSHLLVISPADVQRVMADNKITLPLSQPDAAKIGQILNANAVVVGSLNEVKKYEIRKGWRRLARILTSQKEYVDAVLAVSAIDSTTGIVLVSRANVGEYKVPDGKKDVFQIGEEENAPTQESLENSLDAALREAYYRTLAGLGTLPFKARVVSGGSSSATINYGASQGIKKGDKFICYAVDSVVTNAIGDNYEILGAPLAHLKVSSVSESSATLEVLDGSVNEGDIIQSSK